MCGRYVTRDGAAMERSWNYGWPRDDPARDLAPATFNAAPTQLLPVVRTHPERGPEFARLRWGLIPSWAKDARIGTKMINARGEAVAEKPAFRAAFARRRCLVPMAGYYEWRRDGARAMPHYIHLLNADLFAVAGLHEYWPGRDGAEPVESYTLITIAANEMISRIHDRMPVILAESDHAAWLDPGYRDTGALRSLLRPFPSGEMRAHAVSARVNNARNNGPDLVEPVGDVTAR